MPEPVRYVFCRGLWATTPTYTELGPVHLGVSEGGPIRTLCGIPGMIGDARVPADCPGCESAAARIIPHVVREVHSVLRKFGRAVSRVVTTLRDAHEEVSL